MDYKEKAIELIEHAEAKAETNFQEWKNGYLAEKLKHRNADEVKAILEERYKLISDFLLKHKKPYYDGKREDLIGWYTAFFKDLADGLQPLPGTTPEHWKNVLADRMKARKCLAYIDALLSELQSENPAKPNVEKPRPSTFADLFSDTEGYQRAINALKSRELLSDAEKYIGKKSAIKPFFDALVKKSLLKTNNEEIFATLFTATFGMSITGRTLRNPRIDRTLRSPRIDSQQKDYEQFISLLSIK